VVSTSLFATTTEVRLVSYTRCDCTVRRASASDGKKKNANDGNNDDGVDGVDAAMRARATTTSDDDDDNDDEDASSSVA
jgi:hypothetical protein